MISGLETKDYGAVTAVLEHKTSAPATVEAHQVGAEGIVDAYVAVTGVRDDVGDIIEPGAFVDTLKKLRPKMCLGHDWNRPIGEPVEIEELLPGDPRLPATTHDGQPWPREAGALWTRSRYMLGTQDGRDAYEHAKFYGPRTAYSIGYVPDKTKVRFTSEKGLRTRRLPKLDLYEYGPVLHGAHPLARQGAIKSGQPGDFEGKVRLVRNMEYWGLPVGTPIRPGMKPRGPVARRMERAGKVADENRGVVEIDVNNPQSLRLKPTAKGKAKRNDGLYISDLMMLFSEGTVDPEDDGFVTSDTSNLPDRQRVNRGEEYNPLDMLVANAVTPAELEDDLRNGADWASTQERLGQAEEIQPQVDAFIDDVLDVYREKYNAALVEQHGAGQVDDIAEADEQGDQDVADAVAATAERERPDGQATMQVPTRTPPADEPVTVVEEDRAPGYALPPDPEAGQPVTRQQTAAERSRRKREAALRGDDAEIEAINAERDAEQQEADDAAFRADPDAYRRETTADYQDSLLGGHRATGDPERAGELTYAQLQAEVAQAQRDGNDKLAAAFQAEVDRRDAENQGRRNRLGVGTGERTKNTSDNEIEDVSAGEQPSAVDGEMDVTRDIPAAETGSVEGEPAGLEAPEDAVEDEQDTGEFEPGAVLDDTGQPVPRVPVNDAGDFYDDHGDIVSGSTEYDQALNQATDAINDGDEVALADALAPFVGTVDADGGFGPLDEAARLIEMPASAAIAEVQQWTQQADANDSADFTANRTATVGAFAIADDDYLATEAARMRGILISRSAAGDPPTDGFVREAALRLRLLQAEQAKREQGGEPEQDVTEPVTPEDAAVIAAEELADAQDIADASYGIHEAEDGEFEADSDVADRQDRVAGLLTQADTGGLDFSGYDDDGLRNTRADVLGELRLQSYLETRRRQDRALARQEQEAADANARETTRPDGEAGDVAPDEPPGPRPRPGVAGAAEDLADALDEGDEDRTTATRARLEASLRRSRSTSEHVLALRTLVDAGGDLDPAQLRALAEAIRAETRAKRNASARERRRVRRFERERLRALLGDVEAAMTGRGLEFDAAPESTEDDAISAGLPGAGAWTTKTDEIDWLGYAVTVRETSGTHYRASVTTKPDGRSTYEWEVAGLSGRGDTATPDDAVGMVELILDNHRVRGILPADAVLPQTMPRGTSSALAGDVIAARSDAIAERLATGTVNPLTGEADPLRSQPTLRPPTVAAFDAPLDVREYLLAQVARETDDRKRDQLANAIAQIRWDDVTLSPGGGLAVFSMPGQRGYHIMHTRSGARVDIPINSTSSADLPKADQVRIMAIMESVPDGNGQVIDFNQDQDVVATAVKETWKPTDSNDVIKGWAGTVAQVFIAEKLRSGNLPAGLLKTIAIGADNIGWHNRTNPARYPAVKEKTVALGYLLGNTKADKDTRKTVRHGWALANAGAPDATAALYRRRAEELRQEFGAKAGDRGAVLLDEIADNLLAMWAPEQSQGDRARALKAGERLTITEDEGVRHYRLLTDMRSTSDHARQSEARVIDEATGATYRLGIWNDFNRRDSLTLWPDAKGGNHIWTLPLSGDEFAITGGEEEAPDTAESVRNRARGDIQSVPQDVLDAAANLLAENQTEAEERRATGARSRSDARAPRRRAATPPEVQPIPGEQHLAAAQGQLMPGWVGENYSETDVPAAGGFTSEQEWREFIATDQQRLADTEFARGLDVINHLTYDKVTLSPGGHFIITSKNLVVHARSLQAVWGMGNTHWELTGGAKLTAAGSMAVAIHLERAQLNGQGVDWTKGADEIGEEVQKFTRNNGNIVAPAAKAAFQRMLATSKTVRASDIEAFEVMTREADTGYRAPNPTKLSAVQDWHVAQGNNPYNQAGNARTVGRDRVAVATTKTGQTLAKKVDFEMRLAASMSKVAPLDAVRRLTTIADAIEGQTIETIDHQSSTAGETLDPAKDLRAVAKSITDGYDEKQISPAGMLLRNNFTGTIRPKGTVKFETNIASQQHVTDARYGDTQLTEISVWTDENGVRHATFADHHLVDAPSGYVGEFAAATVRTNTAPGQISYGVIRLNPNTDSFDLSWRDIGGIYTSVRLKDWDFEPPAEPDVPDGDAVPDRELPGNGFGQGRTESDGATSEDRGGSAPDALPAGQGAPSPVNGDRTQEIENKVREIYDGLVQQPGDWAGIVDIRRQLGDQYDRAEVDSVLKQLDRSGVVVIAPESNRKALTEEDHAAAIRIGGEDNHIIMFKQV